MKHGFVIHRQHQVIFVYLACINVIIRSNKQFHRILKILQIVFWKSRPHNWHKKISNVTSTSDGIQTHFNPFQSRKKCAAHTAWYSREDESLLKLATRLTFESSRLAFFIKKSTAIPRSLSLVSIYQYTCYHFKKISILHHHIPKMRKIVK